MKNDEIKNTSISLWCFLFTIALSIGTLNNLVWEELGENLILTGGKFLPFFIFLSGYFLMDHLKNSPKAKTTKYTCKKAWRYTKEQYQKYYPTLLGGVTLSFIVKNIIMKTKIKNLFSIFLNSIWEFIGLSQINFNESFLWNEPLWYISAFLICGLILYYLVAKNEDLFLGFVAPFIIIISLGGPDFIIENNLIRVLSGMTVGMLIFYLVDYLKEKPFDELTTFIFSLLHIGIIMLFIYTFVKGFSWNETTNSFIIMVFCVIILTNKDYVSALYNDSKICLFLGKISFYYYAYHVVFISLLSWFYPEMTYHVSILFNIGFSFCFGFIMMYLDENYIQKKFEIKSKKKNIKKRKA